VVLFDIVTANLAVAMAHPGPAGKTAAGVHRIAAGLRSDLAISLLANTICLTPGTVSAQLSPGPPHAAGARARRAGPGGRARQIKSRYEAPLKEVFEAC
jgi:multicomponent K+:H+ antiporter subunit E